MNFKQHTLAIVVLMVLTWPMVLTAQTARISEEVRSIPTFPFSEPGHVPVLVRDARLYPYHVFGGYATEARPQDWKVVRLENDLIEVFVLPEVGGKVWGAVVKKTGHEFIYRNEVMKFRNIALRGPWTSGGIEFNFGVIGHTPSTATPVDYLLRENADGSVSCIVGAMDLPSRTHWRVEIRLPPDQASFETNVLWYNPTPVEQPYYNWMTAAAFARSDLEMFIPGNAFLEHSGAARVWPTNAAGRFLPRYADNTFGGHKSYHVVGEYKDFFGGYYHDEDYGFGHWARYEEMPGQKLWLWALSREGGVWEDLLTDTDGQYVEYQAGRLFVQYAPGSDVNPISQVGFEAGASDQWSETWFPIEGLGGLSAASPLGAMHVVADGGTTVIRAHSFGTAVDTLRVSMGDSVLATIPLVLRPLEPIEQRVVVPGDQPYRVELRGLGLDYHSSPDVRALTRPWSTDDDAQLHIPEVDRWVLEGSELKQARRLSDARLKFQDALDVEPWNRDALLQLADIDYRRGLFESGLSYVRRTLQLDAYDPDANFAAGNLYRAISQPNDAMEAFGWAARSMKYRSVAHVQMAELALSAAELEEATRHARLALDYDRYNLSALQVLALVGRKQGDQEKATTARTRMLDIDPLHHFVFSESFLERPDSSTRQAFLGRLRGEYPDQIVLELAVDYVRRGQGEDAREILHVGTSISGNPLLPIWRAWLSEDATMLPQRFDPALVFPYRRESIAVLRWAVERNADWRLQYLLALNLWARDRVDETAREMELLSDRPDFPPAYVARAHLLREVTGRDPEGDLRRAATLGTNSRPVQIHLIQYLQDTRRWAEALSISARARDRFPNDFDLDLLHAKTLINLNRSADAIAVLDATEVLPSEHSGESHRLFQQAHTLAALDAIESGHADDGIRHLRTALEWPEHLGQGRPYDPEERFQQFVIGVVELHRGRTRQANEAFDAVVAATDLHAMGRHPLDLLALPALYYLDDARRDSVAVVADAPDAVILAAQGVTLETFRHLLPEVRPNGDVDDRLLRRALALIP